MSVVPRSLFAVDGTLYITSAKSSLMTILEGFKTDQPEAQQYTIVQELGGQHAERVLIVDAMTVLQCVKKAPTMRV